VFVKSGLSGFLLCRICELGLEVAKEISVGIFNIVFNGVELFYSLKHCFHPSVNFRSFDKCKDDGNVSD
jgi:hypothetical protein